MPFLLEDDRPGNLAARVLRGGQPRVAQVQHGADPPRLDARPQRRRDGHLAIADLAQRQRRTRVLADVTRNSSYRPYLWRSASKTGKISDSQEPCPNPS